MRYISITALKSLSFRTLAILTLAFSLLPHPAAAKQGTKAEGLGGPVPGPKVCVPQTMECDSTVTGELTPDDCDLGDGTRIDFWEFQGAAGQVVTIDMTSVEFDTFLFLSDPTSQVVATDDDGGEGTNSRIVHLLTPTGTWTIGANGFGTDDLGNYTLMLSCDPTGQIFTDGFESGDTAQWSSSVP